MVDIPLGLGDWGSKTQDVTRLKLHNMYVVPNPSSPDQASRVSRPTLTFYKTVGGGPVVRTWAQPNLLSGDSLVVSGTELYRMTSAGVSTLVGSIPGTGLVDIAGTVDSAGLSSILLVRNNVLYHTTGVGVTVVAIPDGQPVSSVATINGYFIFSISLTQRFYWLEPGSLIVDPLNFASAERIPDPIKSVNVVSDEIWFLGLSGPEVWTATGDLDAPFQRVSGRVYNEGCHSRDTVVTTSIGGLPSLLWVTDAKAVVKTQGQPQKVSNESIEEILKTSDNLSAWAFRYNRHDFYVISSELFTVVYDISMDQWSRWDTYLLPYWVAQTGFQRSSTVTVGDSTSNKLYILEEGFGDDELPVIREVAGFLRGTLKPVQIAEVIAYTNSGWAPSYLSTPVLELRWSDDRGGTWTDYVSATLGAKGDYVYRVSYRNLGLLRSPGRIFEFKMSDFARFRLDYATLNERLE